MCPPCGTVAYCSETGMPFQDETGCGFKQRCAQEPAACRIEFGTFLERFHCQDYHSITLGHGEQGRCLPERLDTGIGTTQERQIRSCDAKLDRDLCWYGTWSRVREMQRILCRTRGKSPIGRGIGRSTGIHQCRTCSSHLMACQMAVVQRRSHSRYPQEAFTRCPA